VRRGRQLKIGEDDTRLHDGGAGFRIERDDAVQVSGKDHHDAGTDGIAGN
jgi:hypothetical protein